ncbi:MAG TPA: tRNA lysidine(34) synthetase TilS [Mycobacteriales bacterium]|nr:tRNA lysidine(34) synthetase TilS [Mycobacteriales bacterium]
MLRTRAAMRAALADLPPGTRVTAAVSGGADSLALAAALAHAAPRRRLCPGAAVIDHGLQAGSDQQAAVAADQCRELGLDPVVRRVRVGRRGGPEAAARSARYRALDRLDAEVLLLGHTLDDQAETVLLGLARGSGARSLAGMAAVSGHYRRPFLGLRRADTAAACAALGLEPWVDPHNGDRRFLRSAVRLDLMPVLEAVLGAGAVAALGRSAEMLREDADALDEWADKAWPDVCAADGLDVAALAALPAAVRTRVLRRAAVLAGSPAGALSGRQVTAMERLVTDWRGQGPVALPGGLVAERRCDRLSVR